MLFSPFAPGAFIPFPPSLVWQGINLLTQFQTINSRRFASGFAPRRRTQKASGSNQNIITGNLGIVTTGAQNANPINVA